MWTRRCVSNMDFTVQTSGRNFQITMTTISELNNYHTLRTIFELGFRIGEKREKNLQAALEYFDNVYYDQRKQTQNKIDNCTGDK
jgi:hypothetical protein